MYDSRKLYSITVGGLRLAEIKVSAKKYSGLFNKDFKALSSESACNLIVEINKQLGGNVEADLIFDIVRYLYENEPEQFQKFRDNLKIVSESQELLKSVYENVQQNPFPIVELGGLWDHNYEQDCIIN